MSVVVGVYYIRKKKIQIPSDFYGVSADPTADGKRNE